MTRWNWKRWAFAIVTGSALTGSFTAIASDEMPKAGETITLKYPGQADRSVTVIKSVRKPDGSLETEVKDAKTGDTFTLIDPAPENKVPAAPVAVPAVKAPVALPPLPKPVTAQPTRAPAASLPMPLPPVVTAPPKPIASPVAPTVGRPSPIATFSDVPQGLRAKVTGPSAGQTPMPPMPDAREKRPLVGRLFNRGPDGPLTVPNTVAAAAATPPPAPVDDEKKPGLLGRIFGKKPNPPATTITSTPSAAGPALRMNPEPPRAQPVRSATPPTAPGRVETVVPPKPVVPAVQPPAAPNTSIPMPLPSLRPLPVPVAPSVPTSPPVAKPVPPAPIAQPLIPALPPVAAPSIPEPQRIPSPPPIAKPNLSAPTPPQSQVPVVPAVAAKPAGTTGNIVKTVTHAPVAGGLPTDLTPMAEKLKDALAPSIRLKAAQDLAESRYASTESVKNTLFQAAKTDPCPEVKVDCIEHLCRLGYKEPAFIQHLKSACEDPSEDVRAAARSALTRLGVR